VLDPKLTASASGTNATPAGGLQLAMRPTAGVAAQLAPFFKGDKGDPGDVAGEAAIRAIAADQDTVQVYDFDAIVATNLGV
jgi:hypothetical protein